MTVSNRSVLIFSAYNSLLARKTGIRHCFWGVIFYHFPVKNYFNLTVRLKQVKGRPQPCVQSSGCSEGMGDVLGCCWSWSDPHPAHPGALTWRRFIEWEAAATELFVRSRIKPYRMFQQSSSAGLCNLQPWQTWACSCRGWRSHKGLPDSLLWGQERPSLIFNVLILYNALKTLLLHRPTYLHTSVSSANSLFPISEEKLIKDSFPISLLRILWEIIS